MSNEKIKEYYLTKKVDERREFIEYKSQPIYLDSSFLSAIYIDLVDTEWNKRGSSLPDSFAELYSEYCKIFFTITYQQKKEDEIFSLKFQLSTPNIDQVKNYAFYLRQAKISFLIYGVEKYHPNNVLS